MNPADIIKDAVALIKEYAQELSQKEHRNDVESGELIGYTEALFYVQHGLGVFRHLGGDPQHIPVGKRRAANLRLTFRLVLCYNIPSGGCAGLDWLPHEGGGCAGFDWLPHLFYWINIIQILYTVCGFRHAQRGLPDGVIFILNVRRPILPVVLAVLH